jgi:hypothetical protein
MIIVNFINLCFQFRRRSLFDERLVVAGLRSRSFELDGRLVVGRRLLLFPGRRSLDLFFSLFLPGRSREFFMGLRSSRGDLNSCYVHSTIRSIK